MSAPVVIAASGGRPVTQVPASTGGCTAFTVVTAAVSSDPVVAQGGAPITLVDSGGFPAHLYDSSGNEYGAADGELNFNDPSESGFLHFYGVD